MGVAFRERPKFFSDDVFGRCGENNGRYARCHRISEGVELEFRFLLGVTLLFVANRRASRTESVARRRRRSAERTGSIAWGETD